MDESPRYVWSNEDAYAIAEDAVNTMGIYCSEEDIEASYDLDFFSIDLVYYEYQCLCGLQPNHRL